MLPCALLLNIQFFLFFLELFKVSEYLISSLCEKYAG